MSQPQHGPREKERREQKTCGKEHLAAQGLVGQQYTSVGEVSHAGSREILNALDRKTNSTSQLASPRRSSLKTFFLGLTV